MHRRISWKFKLLAVVSLCAGCQPTSVDDAAVAGMADTVNPVIERFVANAEFPFVYVRLEDRSGDVVYEHGVVNQDYLPDVAVDGSTWIRIWSMSKIVTIAIALDLVEEGLIALQDPVTKFLPELGAMQVARGPDGESLTNAAPGDQHCPLTYEPVVREMTVEDLINHKGGFTYTFGGVACFDTLVRAQDLPTAQDSDALIARLAQLPLIEQPGETYYYGLNTTVLGLVAERASGKTLEELVTEKVSGPLGISGLQYGRPAGATLLPATVKEGEDLRAARAGELDIFGANVIDYDPDHALYFGGTGMLATADGYADFLRMLLAGGVLNGYRFLNDASVAQMVAPHTQIGDTGHNGYNIWVTSGANADGTPAVAGLWQGGGYESTSYWVDPERGLVGVIMSQMSGAYADSIARDEAIMEAIYAALPVEP